MLRICYRRSLLVLYFMRRRSVNTQCSYYWFPLGGSLKRMQMISKWSFVYDFCVRVCRNLGHLNNVLVCYSFLILCNGLSVVMNNIIDNCILLFTKGLYIVAPEWWPSLNTLHSYWWIPFSFYDVSGTCWDLYSLTLT